MNSYEIIVESYIDRKRFKEFNALDIIHMSDGCTRILAELADQAELFSLLNKIRDMNLKLVHVKLNQKEEEK